MTQKNLRTLVATIFGLLTLASVASIAYALTLTEEARIMATDATGGDQLGSAVSISGDTIVSTAAGAAPSGTGYVFVRSGGVWTQQSHLDPLDPELGSYYGLSTTVYGDTAVIGSPLTDIGAVMDAGALYVFVRSGGVWTQQQRIHASDPMSLQSYGYSMDLEGDTLVAGSRWNNHSGLTNAGAAYVYTRTGTTWTEQQKIIASDAENYDTFGYAVAVSGDTLVVGAWRVDLAGGIGDAGAAYVYVRSAGHWTEQQKLTASDAMIGDSLGQSVDIEGDTIIVGAPGVDRGAEMDVGAVYVFTRTGTAWSQQAKLQSTLGAAGDLTGTSCAMHNNIVVAGAPEATVATHARAGAGYVFARSGTTWADQGRIAPVTSETDGNYGFTAALDGTTAVFGAPAENLTESPGYLHVVTLTGSPVFPDAGVDAGVDAGTMDAGMSDAGVVDAAIADAAISDAAFDASIVDAGVEDATVSDDAAVADADVTDAFVEDAGELPDAGELADASTTPGDADVMTPDAATTGDAGTNPVDDPGCSCRVDGSRNATNTGYATLLLVALLGVVTLRRRRR